MLQYKRTFAKLLAALLFLNVSLSACGGDSGSPVPNNLEIVTPAALVTTNGSIVSQGTSQSTATNLSGTTVSTQPGTTQPVTTAAPTTVAPSPSPTAAPTATQKPTLPALKKGVLLEPMSWESQTWNNCAPMSALMALSYYGVKVTQAQAGLALRPNGGDKTNDPGDKHVRPEELAAYIQSKGLKTMIRENGSLDTLRQLLSAGIPVIVQQWMKEHDDIGHYRVARGYDLATNVFIFNDSMDKKPQTVTTADLQDKLWKAWDHRYLPVYTQAQEATVMAILGEDAGEQANLNRAYDAAKKYSEAYPGDIDAWRNLGYLEFTKGKYSAALDVWENHLVKMLESSDNGPYNRFLWYQLWPVESYNKVGNYAQVIKMAPNEITHTRIYAEVRYEYAFALSHTGRKAEAIEQLKLARSDDSNYQPAKDLLAQLQA